MLITGIHKMLLHFYLRHAIARFKSNSYMDETKAIHQKTNLGRFGTN